MRTVGPLGFGNVVGFCFPGACTASCRPWPLRGKDPCCAGPPCGALCRVGLDPRSYRLGLDPPDKSTSLCATARSAGQSRHFDILRHARGIVHSAITARRVIERRTSVRCAPKLLTNRTPKSTSAIPATNRLYGMTLRGSVGTRATDDCLCKTVCPARL